MNIASTKAIDVTLGLIDGGLVVFGSEGTELLERKDLWEPWADLIGPAATNLLTMF